MRGNGIRVGSLALLPLLWGGVAWGLPGFVPALKELHPELSPNCATCHELRGATPSHANLNDRARPFYREILDARLGETHVAAVPADEEPDADFFVFGDTRDNVRVHSELVKLMCEASPKAVFHTGDIVANGADARLWDEALRLERCLVDRKLLQPSCGNHEGGYCLDNVLRRALGNDKKFYAKELGPYTFLALDSYAPTAEQLEWLDSLPRGKRYVPFFHYPAYPTMAGHGADAKVLRDFVPRFKKLGVKLVLNGHNHGYDRAVVDGVQWVTSGGGGAPLYPCGPAKAYTKVCASEHHYLKCEASASSIRCIAKTLAGKVLDSFTVDY